MSLSMSISLPFLILVLVIINARLIQFMLQFYEINDKSETVLSSSLFILIDHIFFNIYKL